tara:strand:- start:136 stop:1440 length:1305 start_codon:yes stop_codon:yes gene_type:complete
MPNNRLDLNELKGIAVKDGGKLLSRKYKPYIKLKWLCRRNHIVFSVGRDVKHKGLKCYKCGIIDRRHSIEVFRKLAKSKGGRCLSNSHENLAKKLKFQCKENHVWEATGTHILHSKSWCPKCSNRVPLTLKEAKEFARKKGGKCLSKKIHPFKLQKWSCKFDHIWKSSFRSMKHNNSWCAKCAGLAPLKYVDLKNKAKKFGGKILTKRFLGLKKNYKWMCSKGHIWVGKYSANRWCPICGGSNPLNIEAMHELAKAYNGKFLSKKYVNLKTEYKWKCKKSHVWHATAGHVKHSDSWCPTCNASRSEKICKLTFETIFKVRFPKIRPSWLVGVSGNKIELDGYSKKLKLAYEYNGVQHYKFNNFFYNTKKDFLDRKRNDVIKVRRCREKGIKLIVIKYTQDLNQLPKFIKKNIFNIKELRKYNFKRTINFKNLYL